MPVSNRQYTASAEVVQQIIREDRINGKITSVLNKLTMQGENIHLHDYGFLDRDLNFLDGLEKRINSGANFIDKNREVHNNGREYLTSANAAIECHNLCFIDKDKLVKILTRCSLVYEFMFLNKEFVS